MNASANSISTKKMLVFTGLVTVLGALTGLAYGAFF
jgi:hypothetical protein